MSRVVLFVCMACAFTVGDSVTGSLPPSVNDTLDLKAMTKTISNTVLKNTINDIADPLVKRLLLTISREFIRFALRLEFFTIATGNHLTIRVPSNGMDLEYHKIAAAAAFFWRRLGFMEVVEEIITNATIGVVQNTDDVLTDLSVSDETKMHAILRLVLHRVNMIFSQDPVLSDRYNLMKEKFGRHFNSTRHQIDASHWTPKLLSEEYSIFQQWFSISTIKKFVINKMFLIQCTDSSQFSEDGYERYVLARSLIHLSKNPRNRKVVQKIFYDSVRDTANTLGLNTKENDDRVTTTYYNGFFGELSKYSDVIVNNLFSVLRDKIKCNPILKHDLDMARAVVKRNKDVKFHRIDYWPL